ncbi:hypothetical protein HLH33_10040 [Gluconacetobacter diazotrophicus]|uniref:Transmembrane protein n=1 Tax=Gluconacetobacter diazotrophicus TaxID=33996 RepID=A0A7W4FF68_GLUDI|nr:hypothetical protein [Gluconacetobacter diazotrophicus]MBB2156645.1 hypothetical protein [Gluconacetobacter diazotrophicus]
MTPSIREFRLAWRVGRDGYRYLRPSSGTAVPDEPERSDAPLLISDGYLAYVRQRTRRLARLFTMLGVAEVIWWAWLVIGANDGLLSGQSLECAAALGMLVVFWLRQAFANWQARQGGGVTELSTFLASGRDLWPR